MGSRFFFSMGFVAALVFSGAICALGQGNGNPPAADRGGEFSRLPGDLQRYVGALGGRARTKAREETVLAGLFTADSAQPLEARVVHDLSGELVLEGFKEKMTVTFNGKDSAGESDRTDEALLETFVMDTAEGMFASLGSGGALRVLGRRFGPDPEKNPEYQGPRYDIYEVAAPVRTRRDGAMRIKRYYFDSDSGFLVSTRYQDPSVGRGLKVETRFSGWRIVEGSSYPGLIERFEDGRRVFSFTVATASSGARPQRGESR